MNNNRAGYFFAIFGLASLAAAIACLGWAHVLGGYGFIGATTSIFLAMLSFAKFAELRRAVAGAPPSPMPEPMHASVRAPIMPSQRADDDDDDEDRELEARLAALRLAAQQPTERHIAPPEPELAVEVVEESPLEPELANLFAAKPVEATSTRDTPSSELRQIDELRAELARLRESARMRQAGAPVSVAPPDFLAAPGQPSTLAAELPNAQIPQPDTRESFPRTEFSGLGTPPPSAGSSFTKTEFLAPVELPR